MKRKLIIHVGMGKTGSSSIQKTLRVARNTLEAQGFMYIGLMFEHISLPCKYSWHKVNGWRDYTDIDRVQANQELAHALQYADDTLPRNIHTLIWSNESLFDRIHDVRPALNALCERYDVHVVGYIRRPDSWINSAYLQWGIKDKSYPGQMKPFRAWAKSTPYVVSPKMEAWMELALYSRFYNFDDIKDVSAHFVCDVLSLDERVVPSQRENDTPPPVAMALFAYHNSLSSDPVLPDEIEPLLKQAGLFNPMQKTHPYNNLLPSEEDIVSYLERHREEIGRTNAILEKNGQSGFNLESLICKDFSTTHSDTNRGLLMLIFHLWKEIEALKEIVNTK